MTPSHALCPGTRVFLHILKGDEGWEEERGEVLDKVPLMLDPKETS